MAMTTKDVGNFFFSKWYLALVLALAIGGVCVAYYVPMFHVPWKTASIFGAFGAVIFGLIPHGVRSMSDWWSMSHEDKITLKFSYSAIISAETDSLLPADKGALRSELPPSRPEVVSSVMINPLFNVIAKPNQNAITALLGSPPPPSDGAGQSTCNTSSTTRTNLDGFGGTPDDAGQTLPLSPPTIVRLSGASVKNLTAAFDAVAGGASAASQTENPGSQPQRK